MTTFQNTQDFPARKHLINCFFMALNLALLLLLHGSHLYDSDEGVMLNGAWNLLNGRRLYVDFFEYIPPGSLYLLYGVWHVTGAQYWAAQALGITLLLLGSIGVEAIAKSILKEGELEAPSWSIRSTSFLFCFSSVMWPMINHNNVATVIAVWIAYAIIQAIRRRSLRESMLAGILAGALLVVLQHRGLAVIGGALGIYVFLWIRRVQTQWLLHGLLFSVASLVFPVLLLVSFPPNILVDSLLRFPMGNYWQINAVNPILMPISVAGIAMVSLYLRDRWNEALSAIVVLQCAMLASITPRPDVSHVMAVSFPMLCLLPSVISKYVQTRPRSIFATSTMPFLLTTIAFLFVAGARAYSAPSSNATIIIKFVRDNCSSSPYLYAGPFIPGVYFETRKLNATRYSVLLPGFNTDEQFADAVSALASSDVPCVVMNYVMVEGFQYSRDNLIDRYLAENYTVALDTGGVRVFRKAEVQRGSGK